LHGFFLLVSFVDLLAGDPTGTGKGGTSIWSKKFPDEFKDELKVMS
jgi:cyclophilin family peptidyl-prolyl cis-trans isomerase